MKAQPVQPVTFGSGVWVAPGCIAIRGVEIGENSIIGTGAVVTKSIQLRSPTVQMPENVIRIFRD